MGWQHEHEYLYAFDMYAEQNTSTYSFVVILRKNQYKG